MKLQSYQIDTFTRRMFGGNPAVVCMLESEINDDLLLSIAAENNISTTAFLVEQQEGFDIRYVMPTAEIAFAGHATLAASFVCLTLLGRQSREVTFRRRSGAMSAMLMNDDRIGLILPPTSAQVVKAPAGLAEALGLAPRACLASGYQYFAVYDSEEQIVQIDPDMQKLMQLDRDSIVVTAAGRNCDFVSRAFAPKEGLPEDPVCGAAHLVLAPYWAKELRRNSMRALQLSDRGGELFCEYLPHGVALSGHCRLFSSGLVDL